VPYLKPKSTGIRDPLTDEQTHGRIVNTPRFARLGGFTSAKKGVKKNAMKITKPGGGATSSGTSNS
jgi:hypothetical protein